jgi:rhamnulokinase
VVEPDHPSFLSPSDMPAAIAAFCRATQQHAPDSPADFARCIFVSLALKYRLVLDQLRRIYPHPINRLHVIGGGSQNAFLCQLTADVCGVPVAAGPVEATAVGNMLVQAMGIGAVGSPGRLRAIVRESFPVTRYEPRGDRDWEQEYARFAALHAQSVI